MSFFFCGFPLLGKTKEAWKALEPTSPSPIHAMPMMMATHPYPDDSTVSGSLSIVTLATIVGLKLEKKRGEIGDDLVLH